MTAALSLRAALWAIDLALLGGALALPPLWLLGRIELRWGPLHPSASWGPKPFLVLAAMLVIRTLLARHLRSDAPGFRSLWSRGWALKLFMAFTAVFAATVVAEWFLARAGYEVELPPIIIRNANREVIGRYGIQPCPELRWRFSPGGEFKGWKINQLGFREREINPAKNPGQIRLIALGDSCTADGGPPYAGCLHELVQRAPPTENEWEAFNMGVYGYSSVQGLRLFRKKVRDLRPEIVTLYFGWNDHWISGFKPDSSYLALPMTPRQAFWFEALRRKRVGQLWVRLLTRGRNVALPKRRGVLPPHLESGYRVPPDEFRLTLADLAREIRAVGAVPVFLTAPRGPRLTQGHVDAGQIRSIDEGTRVHDEYCEITRAVARSTGSPMLDLRALLAPNTPDPIFIKDGVHLKQHGHWRVAEELYRKVLDVVGSDRAFAAAKRTAPREAPTLFGNWSGEVQNDTNDYRMALSLAPSSGAEAFAGSFTNHTLAFSRTFVCTQAVDGTFFLTVREKHGAGVEDETREYLRPMPDGSLLFTSCGPDTETIGRLSKTPGGR